MKRCFLIFMVFVIVLTCVSCASEGGGAEMTDENGSRIGYDAS